MAAGTGEGVETVIVRCVDDVKTSLLDTELNAVKPTTGEGFGGFTSCAASV